MPNNIPISGATLGAGGILLPFEQGQMLAVGLLSEQGTLRLAGDSRTTDKRKTKFPIWLGEPTAEMVGEGERKHVTGAEFGQTEMNVKKLASIVLFTDEQIEDVQDGDMNVLVDGGVRKAIAKTIDRHITGKDVGANYAGGFDNYLRQTTVDPVAIDVAKGSGLRDGISEAIGILEDNGYGDLSNLGVVLGHGFGRLLRDAKVHDADGSDNRPLYDANDPLFGLDRAISTNLNGTSAAAGASNVIGYVIHKPNFHVRIRHDVRIKPSTDASIELPNGETVNLYQDNMTALRYEVRLAAMVHDLDRAVVPLTRKA
jgi:hypothetical protein